MEIYCIDKEEGANASEERKKHKKKDGEERERMKKSIDREERRSRWECGDTVCRRLNLKVIFIRYHNQIKVCP